MNKNLLEENERDIEIERQGNAIKGG